MRSTLSRRVKTDPLEREIEAALQPGRFLPTPAKRGGVARHGDLVALPGIAHVERALDHDLLGRKAVAAQIRGGERFEPLEHAVHLFEG